MTPKSGRARALYIAVEGIDGAGKSTFTRGLVARLRAMGLTVRLRHEPMDPSLGAFAQRVGPTDPWSSAVFFTLDRYLARRELESDLARADVVVTDRSLWSTIAYQGSALPPRMRTRLERMQFQATRSPDRVILLDLPVGGALRRLAGRGGRRAPFERRPTLERVALAYRRLSRAHGWIELDARRPAADLAEAAVRRLSPRLRSVRVRRRR